MNDEQYRRYVARVPHLLGADFCRTIIAMVKAGETDDTIIRSVAHNAEVDGLDGCNFGSWAECYLRELRARLN